MILSHNCLNNQLSIWIYINLIIQNIYYCASRVLKWAISSKICRCKNLFSSSMVEWSVQLTAAMVVSKLRNIKNRVIILSLLNAVMSIAEKLTSVRSKEWTKWILSAIKVTVQIKRTHMLLQRFSSLISAPQITSHQRQSQTSPQSQTRFYQSLAKPLRMTLLTSKPILSKSHHLLVK